MKPLKQEHRSLDEHVPWPEHWFGHPASTAEQHNESATKASSRRIVSGRDDW